MNRPLLHHGRLLGCLLLCIAGCHQPASLPPPEKPALSSVSPDPAQLEKARAQQAPPTKKSADELYQERAEKAVKSFCGRCHAFPAPEDFTMETWGPSIRFMYQYFKEYKIDVEGGPPPFITMRYYAERAAKTIRTPSFDGVDMFQTRASRTRVETDRALNAVSDVAGVSRRAGFGGDVVVANMLTGSIEAYDTRSPTTKPKQLATLTHPARMTVTDLDGDGRQDLLIGELGTFGADDHKRGSAYWIRQKKRGRFETIPLAKDLGRVAEVASGRLDGDRINDVVIAEFGWLNTGSLTVVHNPSRAKKSKAAKTTRLDSGRGATSVQVGDLTGDGKEEIVALFGQEREEAIVYQRGPDGTFVDTTIFRADTPLWGATRLRLADLDKDGDLDVIIANGDTLDAPRIAAFQGIHVLENQGGLRFEPRQLLAFPGVHDFQVLDYDKDGDQDIVAVSSLPPSIVKLAQASLPAGKVLASAILLRQEKDKKFKAITLAEDGPCYSSVGLPADPKDGHVYVGQFGLGWDVLGHDQTITAHQVVLNECNSNVPVEAWSLVAPEDAKPSPPPLDRIAQRLEDRARLHQRAAAFGRLLETQPLKADYHMARGITLAQLGNKEDALKVMRRAVQMNPTAAELKVNVATLLNEIDEHKEAISMAEAALRQRPEFAEAFNAKAIALAKMGNRKEALNLTERAASMRPDFLPYQFNLVHLYMIDGRGPEALKILDGVLAAQPGHRVALQMKRQITAQMNGTAPRMPQ